MVFCFSSSYRLTRVLCFVLFLADFGRAHVGGSYRTCVCSLKSLNKKVSESRPRLKQACCTRTLRGPFESFIFLCMHCFYVCKREKMGEEIVCKVCKSQFFSLLLHFIPSYYPKTNKQKKGDIHRFSSSPWSSSAALRHVFASLCAFCLSVSLQLEKFGCHWRLQAVRSGAWRVRG